MLYLQASAWRLPICFPHFLQFRNSSRVNQSAPAPVKPNKLLLPLRTFRLVIFQNSCDVQRRLSLGFPAASGSAPWLLVVKHLTVSVILNECCMKIILEIFFTTQSILVMILFSLFLKVD